MRYCENALQIWEKLRGNSSQNLWNFGSMKCTTTVNGSKND